MSGYIFTLLLVFGCLSIVFAFIFVLARMNVNKEDRSYNPEETEIIQELNRGMEKMASRIEALETILLDQGEHYRRTPPPLHDRGGVSS